MTFESAGLLIVAIYIWLPPASYVVFLTTLVIFGSIPKSNFWRVFDVFLDLVIFAYFNAISIDFYAVKSFICIYFV